MKMNINNILVIAQKEFADIVWSPRFLVILGILMVAVLARGYEAGQIMARGVEITENPLMMGFALLSYVIGSIGALVAIILSFEAIVKERKSGSLNVLMTHPVYRDNVITGKLVGMIVALSLVILMAVAVSVGIMLIISGITVNPEEFSRIIIFVALVFLLLLIYLALGITTSIFSKESSHSLVYSIAVWFFLGMFIDIAFIFDMNHTLGYLIKQYWVNLAVLIVSPVILLIISFVAFLRQDITL